VGDLGDVGCPAAGADQVAQQFMFVGPEPAVVAGPDHDEVDVSFVEEAGVAVGVAPAAPLDRLGEELRVEATALL
jgi:hypothetical protein